MFLISIYLSSLMMNSPFFFSSVPELRQRVVAWLSPFILGDWGSQPEWPGAGVHWGLASLPTVSLCPSANSSMAHLGFRMSPMARAPAPCCVAERRQLDTKLLVVVTGGGGLLAVTAGAARRITTGAGSSAARSEVDGGRYGSGVRGGNGVEAARKPGKRKT
ncbi:uncharacterized protein B0I36DRAFT_342676 [Microdochium trichocladiopsis]|uniref:Uncharacterized protein n=1 Tax=Microdochium trichocladiopsis TaxID=1682393 RepID=A0A9P8XPL6_9PEZI|nr:uncharacterized protein B0I36DRAFT_342676 [Microdochium trichocladiopsis]KAH7009247.1 hypothetical protein B0I36DRAFT_342676 [Microdochium trichocladiopsis]